tara:strand:- start:2839 stop:3141 length:303 start_codon:yes stop_codon:yes gene_type:complete
MKTYNIKTPSSLQVMTARELERAILSSIKKPICNKDLVPSLEERHSTRRAANTIASQISCEDLTLLHECLQEASEVIDFTKQYFIQTDPHRSHFTLRQKR